MIWNGREPPLERNWPRLHVPVIFINSTVNSLNNRFLPYEQVKCFFFLVIHNVFEIPF